MTQLQYERDMTPAQRDALLVVYARKDIGQTWQEFIESAQPDPLMGCLMVPWCGMWLGIEKDGHTHS